MTRKLPGEKLPVTTVLMVSPLPPPAGGIATWTEVFRQRGLPPPFRIRLVDTRVERTHWSSPARPGLTELKRTFRILRAVRRSLKDGVAIMHLSCSLSPVGVFRDWTVARITAASGVPFVVELHGLFTAPEGFGPLAALRRRAYRGMFSRAAAVLVLNGQSADAVTSLGRYAERTRIVTNAIDFARCPERAARQRAGDAFRAVFVGANIEAKGVFRVLEIARSYEHMTLRYVGAVDAGVRSRIAELVERWKLGSRVSVEGQVSHDRVLSILAESDVLLFPTTHPEGFPLAVAEAMAVGLPVVSSPVGAIPDMVEHGRGGFVIRAEDVDAYAAALRQLHEDSALRERMGAFNREKAFSQYDHAVVARQMADLYLQILGRGETTAA